MSTHAFIPLYVDDYDSHTAHLSPEEDGVYGRLLRLCWRSPGCALPNDHAWIARKIRLSAEDYERIARPVIDEFFSLNRGRLIQRRLKREYDDISRKQSVRKLAGKKGGEAKARKTKEKSPSTATVLPGDTRAFPEPYPEPEREGSVSNETGGEPPNEAIAELAQLEPRVKSWRLARRVLMERGGVASAAAGKLIGKWVNTDGLSVEDLWEIACAAWTNGTTDPSAYMAAAARDTLIRQIGEGVIDQPSERQQRAWMEDWRDKGRLGWKRHERGPCPGEPGCRISAAIQGEFAVEHQGEAA